MKPRKNFPEELRVMFNDEKNLAFYEMKSIVVDEIFSSWLNPSQEFTLYKSSIVDLKDDVDPASTERNPYFSGEYEYTYDGYPIDEEVYLKAGWVISTNPINRFDREEALKR